MKQRDILTRLVRTRPLCTASILFLLGAYLGYAYAPDRIFCCFFFLFTITAGIICCKLNRRLFSVFILLAFLPAGALRFTAAWNSTRPVDELQSAVYSGTVCEIPVYKEDKERTVCVLDDVSIDDFALSSRLRLYLRGDSALLQSVVPGQRITGTGHLWAADVSTNTNQFSFRDYLRSDGIAGYITADIASAELSPPEYSLWLLPLRVRSYLSEKTDALFKDQSPIAKALLLGIRTDLSDNEKEAYSKAGIAHILAISGMHISVLAFCIAAGLKRLIGRKYAHIVTVLILAVYGLIIGFPASFFRSFICYILLGFAPVAGRFSDAPTRLGFAALIHALLYPTQILSAGFILSYGAVAGIIFLSDPLKALTHTDVYLKRKASHDLRGFVLCKLPQVIVSSVITALAAQIMILPAVVAYFGTQPAWSLITNIIAVPIVLIGYAVSIIALLTGIPFLAEIGSFAFALLKSFANAVSRLPITSIRVAAFPLWLIFLYLIVLFCSTPYTRLRKPIKCYLTLAFIPAILISQLISNLNIHNTKLVFFDAGQADCCMLQSEGKLFFFDTGDAYTPAGDFLSAGGYNVEAVFLTHLHSDHAGGLSIIMENSVPKSIYISSNRQLYEADEGIVAALKQAEERGSEIITVSAGDCIDLTSTTSVTILSPEAGFAPVSANDDSLLLHLSFNGCSALITGDLSAECMPEQLPDVDILKVPHHGALDSIDEALLNKTTPSLSVVSVGYNTYGHPRDETLELLERSATRILRTDQTGMISCEPLTDGIIRVHCFNDMENTNDC